MRPKPSGALTRLRKSFVAGDASSLSPNSFTLTGRLPSDPPKQRGLTPLTAIMMHTDWTKVLGWPGYRAYQSLIDEPRRLLTLRVRRKRGNRKLVCSNCGRRVHEIRAVYERKVRDLPCFAFQTAVLVECYRIRCPNCGVKAECNPQLPSKAPYSKRFEDAVGEACEGAAARQGARR